MYNISHFPKGNVDVYESKPFDLYSYKAYIGHQTVNIEQGDSAWIVTEKKAKVIRGPKTILNKGLCVVIRGYKCDSKTSKFESISNLPYVNGCSSHQVFPPVRVGDPTMQLLYLPANTQEQVHHIHSTVRAVFVLKGKGYSVQGMKGELEQELNEGDVIILDKMTPHHFKTEDSELIVIPIHVFSSTILEKSHPMMNGTFEV